MSSDNSPHRFDRVLITGATSFPGRRLASALMARGQSVHALVRPSSDTTVLDPTAEVHVYDGQPTSLASIIEQVRPTITFHLATLYRRHHTNDDIQPMIDANVGLGTALLDALAAQDCPRIVTVGTYFEFYGQDDSAAVNLYAATKQAFDRIIDYYEDLGAIQPTRLIMFDGYGEGDPRRKLMWAIRNAAQSGGDVALPDRPIKIDLIHVDDVVAAMLHVMDNDIVGGPYALSGGAPVSIEALVDLFESVHGQPINRKQAGFAVPARHPDQPWRGEPVPGWQPRVSLEEGVRRFMREGANDED